MDSYYDNRLKDFKDIHEGERGFIVACGPSLNDTDLSLLKDEVTLTLGLSYLHEDFKSNYHFIGDKKVAMQNLEGINGIECDALFVSKGIYKEINNPNKHFFVGGARKGFYDQVTKKIYGGKTSTFLALQFAHYMGLSYVYLLGLDHKWDYEKTSSMGMRKQGKVELLKNLEDDPNHFSKDYFPKGSEWYKPDIEALEESYSMAQRAYRMTGRRLYNASIRSKLNEKIISRVDYYSLF